MRAITVAPRAPGTAQLVELEEPAATEGVVLVETLTVGVCRTDAALVAGTYGWAPPGSARLVIGHESLGRVLEAPADCELSPGDLVVGMVRGPDPKPCVACAGGDWDLCRNDGYTERGIKRRHGYAIERYRCDPACLIRVEPYLNAAGVLLEPASLVAKAWEHIQRIGPRAKSWSPRRVLVTGAGPVGLLAALLGVQRGLEVHVLDQVAEGPKPQLVADLGATYHTTLATAAGMDVDVLLECTGVSRLVIDSMSALAPDAIVCMTGVSSGVRSIDLTPYAPGDQLVLHNHVLFATVSSARRHYEAAADALARSDQGWLNRLITRRVSLERWLEAFDHRAGDLKVVIDLTCSED